MSQSPHRHAPPRGASFPETVAAVDLGSNSFHMIVARTTGGQPVVVDRLREMVQLANGLDASKRITDAARRRALECLGRFGERVQHMPPGSVRAVGTNTLRSAQNAPEFLREAETVLGHPIETISGIEEARLIYLGVTRTMADPACRHLVVDIGGGSSEIIVGESLRPLEMESLYMGCVTLTRSHFSDGSVDASRWRRAELLALQELEPVQARFRDLQWERALGASGTVRSIASVARNAGWEDGAITGTVLRKLRDAILAAGHVDRLDLDGLGQDRRAIFPAGVVILTAIFEALAVENLEEAVGALREGLLYDLLGRLQDEDARLQSVRALAERYHVDWNHARRVESTACALLCEAAEDWRLDSPSIQQLLTWAAWLHEIGLDIAHAHYHKHGEYIIRESDLFGFSREEQRILALLVRAHRRKFPVAVLKGMPRPWDRKLQRVALLLRIAITLHRSHGPVEIPVPRLRVDRKRLKLRFPDGWLDQHPLTRTDLEIEQSHLHDAGFRLELE